MGIPTVSIDLRKMIRKAGHDSPAKEKLKRMTIQYDQPRHAKNRLDSTAKNRENVSVDLAILARLCAWWL